jgi:hypothetical protein
MKTASNKQITTYPLWWSAATKLKPYVEDPLGATIAGFLVFYGFMEKCALQTGKK